MWFMYVNKKLVNVPFSDAIVIFCQYIDRSFMIFCVILIFVESIMLRKEHFKIFDILSEIDESLLKNFGIKMSYQRNTIINHIITSFNFFTFVSLVRRFFDSYGFANTSEFAYFIIFATASMLILFLESFYVAIIIQLFIRFRRIDNHLNVRYSETHKAVIYDIFVKTYEMINAMNDTFGIFILLATRNNKQLAFSLLFKQ